MEENRPLCSCGNLCERKYKDHKVRGYYKVCNACRRRKRGTQARYKAILMKTDAPCAKCGFLGHPCQMDIDHIDGNSKNNDAQNLQVLCANCHRLKTLECKDYLPFPTVI